VTPEAERTALEELLASDGWAIHEAHITKAWGAEACENALREAKQSADPADWPFESARILDTFAAVRANLTWPKEQVRRLKDGTHRQAIDPFRHFRRRA
jgi:hypothetical protein